MRLAMLHSTAYNIRSKAKRIMKLPVSEEDPCMHDPFGGDQYAVRTEQSAQYEIK